MEPKKVLVIGARGAVGEALTNALRRDGHDVTPAGRSGGGGGVAVDLSTPDGRHAMRVVAPQFDVIVNTSGVEEPTVVEALGETPFVDISATGRYLDALRSAAGDTTVVVGAGLAPGLSTVLTAALDSQPGDDIDVAVMLGAGEAHGAAAVDWTVGLVGTDVFSPPEMSTVRNLHERRRFDDGGGERAYLRADFPDHVLIGAPLGVSVRSYLALSNAFSTASLRLVGRLPFLAPLISSAPHLGDDRWSVLVVNRRTGQRLVASGRGQSLATGELAAQVAIAAADAPQRGAVTVDALLGITDLAAAPSVTLDAALEGR